MTDTRQTFTEGDILDRLADTCKRVRVYGPGEAARVFCLSMTERERLAFDLFLVRTGDELAYRAGSPESRFVERARLMVTAS